MTVVSGVGITFSRRTGFIAFALVALLTSLALSIFLVGSHRQTEQSVDAAVHDVALTIKTRIDGTLRRVHGDLDQLAALTPEDALEWRATVRYAEQMHQELKRRTTHFPEISSYRVYDENGDNLYSSAPEDPEHHIADRDYFQAAKADPSRPLTYSQSIIGKVSKKPIVVIARPLRDRAGRFRGVVMGVLDLVYFVQIISSIGLGPQGVLSVRRTEDGALVVRWPETSGQLNVPLHPEHPIRAWLQSNGTAT